MSENPNVWADGYGKWHASVPISTPNKQAHAARALIHAELEERLAPNYDRSTLRITREHVTNHGTVVYGEVWL